MNIRRLIAQAVAAIVITGTALALVPGSAKAYSMGHGPKVTKAVSLNYWHHRHHRRHHHWH